MICLHGHNTGNQLDVQPRPPAQGSTFSEGDGWEMRQLRDNAQAFASQKKNDPLLVFSGCSHHSLCMHTDASTTRPISQEVSTWSDADSHMVTQPHRRAEGCWVPEAI